MKFRECVRLGQLSLQSRKKSSRNTVFGIAFGLSLLIPVIFFSIAFSAASDRAINSHKTFLTIHLAISAEETSAGKNNHYAFGRKDLGEFAAQDDLVERVDYAEYYALDGGNRTNYNQFYLTVGEKTLRSSVLLDGFSYDVVSQGGRLGASKIKAADPQGAILPAVENELRENGKSAFLSGREPQNPGEVAISEIYARQFYSAPERAVGEKLTLKAFGLFHTADSDGTAGAGYFRDNDTNPYNEPVYAQREQEFSADILRDFTVVGVISDDYYGLNNITAMDAHFWVSRSAVYGEGDLPKFCPTLTRESADAEGTLYRQIVTYPEDFYALEQKAANEKMCFFAVPIVTFASLRSADESFSLLFERPLTMAAIQCKDFSAANEMANFVDRVYAGETGRMDYAFVRLTAVVAGFGQYQTVYNISTYVIVVLCFVGGVVLFATLLGLYNSVNYSVQIRRNYLGMMRAIGAEGKDLPKLYFVELLLLFYRSMLWIIPVSCAISLYLKFLVRSYFAKSVSDGLTIADILGVSFELNFGYWAIALLLTAAVILAIAVLYAYTACRKLAKSGITEILSDER